MADYVGFCRSSYFFKAKDVDAFRRFCGELDLTFFQDDEDPELVGFYAYDTVPRWRWNESGDCAEFDFFDELAGHLQDGWAAEVREVGYEKMRHLVGYSVAVRSSGAILCVNLDDLSVKVRERWPGVNVTACEY